MPQDYSDENTDPVGGVEGLPAWFPKYADPFSGLFNFGPGAGTNIGDPSGNTPYPGFAGAQVPVQTPQQQGPEMLPWGVMAQDQQSPLTQVSPQGGGGPAPGFLQQIAAIFGGGQQNPNQPPKEGQPGGLGQSIPFPEVDRGFIGNLSRSIYGPSNAEIVQHQEYVRKRGQELQQNAAGAEILRRVGELKAQSPDMPKAMLQQQVFSDPVFLKNVMQHSPQEMAKLVSDVSNAIYGEDKFINVNPGDSVLTANPAMNAPGQPQVKPVYHAPFVDKPGAVKRSMVMQGNDPRLAQYRFTGLKPDASYEFKFAKDAMGNEYIADVGAPNGQAMNLDLSGITEREELQRTVRRVGEIQKAQSNVLQMVRTATRLEELLDRTGAGAMGPYAAVTQLGQAFIEQGRAIAESNDVKLPFDPESSLYALGFKAFKNLDNAASDAAQVKANILSLAFSLARANNSSTGASGQITQKDINAALEELGSKWGSATQLRAALPELIRRNVHSVDDAIRIERKNFIGASGKAAVQPPQLTSDLLKEAGLTRYFGGSSSNAINPTRPEPTRMTPKPATGGDIPKDFVWTSPDGKTKKRFKGGSNTPDNWEDISGQP